MTAVLERACSGCGADISHRRPQATTCGRARCRKRRQRTRERGLEQARIESLPSALSASDIASEERFDLVNALLTANGAGGVRRDGWVIA